MILCEARGLQLFSVIRGGIGLSRRLGAGLQHTECLNERLDTLPRTGASQEPIGYHRGMKNLGRSPGFYSMLKLLASSVVRRRNGNLAQQFRGLMFSALGQHGSEVAPQGQQSIQLLIEQLRPAAHAGMRNLAQPFLSSA